MDMVVKTGFSSTNYRWNLAREIQESIRGMTDHYKLRMLETIQTRKAVCAVVEAEYNDEVCQYIESLLQGKRPVAGIARR